MLWVAVVLRPPQIPPIGHLQQHVDDDSTSPTIIAKVRHMFYLRFPDKVRIVINENSPQLTHRFSTTLTPVDR